MDVNRLIRKIRIDLGLNGILKDIVNDEELFDIIDLKTRDTFSRFFKHVFIVKNLNFNKDIKSKHDEFKYQLPYKVIDTIEQMEISINGIKDVNISAKRQSQHIISDGLVFLPDSTRHSAGTSFMGHHHVRAGYNKARNEILRSPLECEFIEPFFIRIKQKYYNIEERSYDVEFFSDHPKNLSTIKDSYGETFEKLAKLDVKIALWENMIAYLNNLDLGQNQIDLKKEKWSNAEKDRDDLVEEFGETFISDYPSVVVL